jgi:uridine kinase
MLSCITGDMFYGPEPTSKFGRKGVIDDLAMMIAALQQPSPVRVAVDGRTASGKTRFADELAARIMRENREVIRTSIDGFHNPKAIRYARGRYSAEGYYFDARDLTAIRMLLLDPLGPDGDRRYRTTSFDLEMDTPIDQTPLTASEKSVLLVDGTFLQRPELIWDLTIFVESSEQISEERGVNRDAVRLGGLAEARQLYANRYRPAFDLYEKLCKPRLTADVVIENDDLENPRLRIRAEGRLANQLLANVT